MNRIFTRKMWDIALPVAVLLGCSMPLYAKDDSATIFKDKCSICHAADGSGNTPAGKKLGALDLRSPDVQKKTDAELFDFTKNGVGKTMPAYKDQLNDAQIKQMVAYIRGLAKKN